MSKQTINIGASPNDGTGTPLRTSFDYTNQNFTEIYTALGGGVALPGATTQVIFNDGGTNLAGDAGLVYNKTTDALTVAGLVTAGSATITGAATVGTTLGVTGVSTLTGNVGVGVTPTNVAGHTRVEIKGSGSGNLTLRTASSNAAARDWQVACNLDTFGELNFRQGASQGAEPNSGTTRMVLTAAGDVSVSTGNVVMATSGKGIDFSATANSSGTMTSELLNDYEEGTWVPTQGTGLTVVGAFSSSGTYTKIGRTVYITGQVNAVTGLSATASGIICSGLPFSGSAQAAATAMNGPFNAGSFCAVNVTDFYAVSAVAGTTSLRFSATYIV